MTKLTTADIGALYARLRSRGAPGGRPLGAASVRRTHVVVHAALAQAVRWKGLRINPASNASPPRVVTPEIVPPAPGDVARLLTVLADLDAPLHAYVRLAATSGARRSRIVGLRWCDVLRGVRLHDLRHYVATRMLSSGADVRTVAGRLGHANPSVTLNVYAQFLPQSDRRAAEALGALLDEPEVS